MTRACKRKSDELQSDIFLSDDGATTFLLTQCDSGLHVEFKQRKDARCKIEHHFLFSNNIDFNIFIDQSPLRFDFPQIFLKMKRVSSEVFAEE